MNAPNLNSKLPATELGVLLRHWRDTRGRSQIDLSLDTGVSQRHISFIESGRSVPSRSRRATLPSTRKAHGMPRKCRASPAQWNASCASMNRIRRW
jgi:predicted transcriptional regulator